MAQHWRSLSSAPRVTKTAVTDEDSVAADQHWHSLSNVLLTNTPVTDEGITALRQFCHSLSNVWSTSTAVTDGRHHSLCLVLALANQRHSLPNVSLTNAEVTDEGTTAVAQHWCSLSSPPV